MLLYHGSGGTTSAVSNATRALVDSATQPALNTQPVASARLRAGARAISLAARQPFKTVQREWPGINITGPNRTVDGLRLWPDDSIAPVKLHGIYWVHVPKTATSFGKTVLSYACGWRSFDFNSVTTGNPVRIAENCGGTQHSLQAGENHSWMHMPVPPSLQGTGAGVVMLFRAPMQRVLSASHMITRCGATGLQQCRCCGCGGGIVSEGWSWGWKPETRSVTIISAAANGTRGFVSALGSRHALLGCYTKMLNGIGCFQEYPLTGSHVDRAVELVKRIAFVGHLETYEESVCLFHAMHGGAVASFEIDSKPLKLTPYDTCLLPSGLSDKDPDRRVYQAAMTRYRTEVVKHQGNVSACMAAVRRFQSAWAWRVVGRARGKVQSRHSVSSAEV